MVPHHVYISSDTIVSFPFDQLMPFLLFEIISYVFSFLYNHEYFIDINNSLIVYEVNEISTIGVYIAKHRNNLLFSFQGLCHLFY